MAQSVSMLTRSRIWLEPLATKAARADAAGRQDTCCAKLSKVGATTLMFFQQS